MSNTTKSQKLNVIIFGSTGYIGWHLKYFLNKHNIFYSLIDRQEIDFYVKANFTDSLNKFKKLINNSDIIFFLSSKAKSSQWGDDDVDIFSKNFSIFCENISLKKIVYLSSIDIYGENLTSTTPLSESTLVRPSSDYAKSKISAETILTKFLPKNKLQILRLPGIYGANPLYKNYSKSGLANRIAEAIINNKFLVLDSPEVLSLRRDWVHISDLIDHLLKMARDFKPGVYNFVTGDSRSIQDFINVLESEFQSKAKITYKSYSNLKKNHLFFDNNLLLNTFSSKMFTAQNSFFIE